MYAKDTLALAENLLDEAMRGGQVVHCFEREKWVAKIGETRKVAH